MIQVKCADNKNIHLRTALLRSVSQANDLIKSPKDILIYVSTKIIVKNILGILASKKAISVLYFTGFGRIFTEFGPFGRFFFDFLIKLADLRNNVVYWVENPDDATYLIRKSCRPVKVVMGSGFNTGGLTVENTKIKNQKKNFTIGYISRFGKSKKTDLVVQLLYRLENDFNFFICGYDINGTQYSRIFSDMSAGSRNIDYIGESQNPNEDFYTHIDLLVYPSAREGLPITLMESLAAKTPFITSDVPGCRTLAKEFKMPALRDEEFSKISPKFIQETIKSSIPQEALERLDAKFSNRAANETFTKLILQLYSDS